MKLHINPAMPAILCHTPVSRLATSGLACLCSKATVCSLVQAEARRALAGVKVEVIRHTGLLLSSM